MSPRAAGARLGQGPVGTVTAPLADRRVTRVAIVRLRVGLGDLLCTVPALRALRRARPGLRVTMVTWAETAPAFPCRWTPDGRSSPSGRATCIVSPG